MAIVTRKTEAPAAPTFRLRTATHPKTAVGRALVLSDSAARALAAEAGVDRRSARVLACVSRDPLESADVAHVIGEAPEAVAEDLRRMVSLGYVRRIEKGAEPLYEPTLIGHAALHNAGLEAALSA